MPISYTYPRPGRQMRFTTSKRELHLQADAQTSFLRFSRLKRELDQRTFPRSALAPLFRLNSDLYGCYTEGI
jgi:hypothetical protein